MKTHHLWADLNPGGLGIQAFVQHISTLKYSFGIIMASQQPMSNKVIVVMS